MKIKAWVNRGLYVLGPAETNFSINDARLLMMQDLMPLASTLDKPIQGPA